MFNNEELALIWFDYNDVSFLKSEKILDKFDKIDAIFDKNKVKNAIFKEKELNEIKEKLLKLDKENFKNYVLEEFYKYNISAVTFVSKNYPEKLKNIDDEEYLNQLEGYKNYIYNKTKKEVNIYLYSILDNDLKIII